MGRPPALDLRIVRSSIREYLGDVGSATAPELRSYLSSVVVHVSGRTLERYTARAIESPEFEFFRARRRHGPTVTVVRLRRRGGKRRIRTRS